MYHTDTKWCISVNVLLYYKHASNNSTSDGQFSRFRTVYRKLYFSVNDLRFDTISGPFVDTTLKVP